MGLAVNKVKLQRSPKLWGTFLAAQNNVSPKALASQCDE